MDPPRESTCQDSALAPSNVAVDEMAVRTLDTDGVPLDKLLQIGKKGSSDVEDTILDHTLDSDVTKAKTDDTNVIFGTRLPLSVHVRSCLEY